MTKARTEELYDFLLDLAADPARALAFATSPEAALEGSGLSSANLALLRRRDAQGIHAVFTHDGVTTAATFGDPGPDPMPDPDPPPPPDPNVVVATPC